MSDKEQLENISPIGFDLDGNFLLKGVDYLWLMEQAERVQEMEEENISLKAIKEGNEELIKMLEQQNNCYREALEFYADENNYVVTWDDDYEQVLQDGGEIARQALKG